MVENRKDEQTSYWDQFINVFTMEYCPLAFYELRRREFKGLHKGIMIIIEYERKFRELSEFCTHWISDVKNKKTRFLDGLNENIALNIAKVAHPIY